MQALLEPQWMHSHWHHREKLWTSVAIQRTRSTRYPFTMSSPLSLNPQCLLTYPKGRHFQLCRLTIYQACYLTRHRNDSAPIFFRYRRRTDAKRMFDDKMAEAAAELSGRSRAFPPPTVRYNVNEDSFMCIWVWSVQV